MVEHRLGQGLNPSSTRPMKNDEKRGKPLKKHIKYEKIMV